jgi:hypothetical protein
MHSIICRLQVHKTEVQGSLEASVLVNDVLQNKRLMDGAVIRPVGYLSKRPHVMLLSVVLCEVNQALNQGASIQPAEPRRSSPTAIGLDLAVYVHVTPVTLAAAVAITLSRSVQEHRRLLPV